MRLGHSAAVIVAFVVLGSVAACGGSDPTTDDAEQGTSGDQLTVGTEREAPLDEPCQWLSIPEATEAMKQAGINTGSDIRTATNPGEDDSDEVADCWYLTVDTQAGRLVVTLVSSEEAATNWRTSMEEVAAQGGHDVTDHGQIQTLTRVADAPVLQLSSPGDAASCDVHALLGDDSVVGVVLAADDAADADALCAEANAALETVVERLPKAD